MLLCVNTKQVLDAASKCLEGLKGHVIDVLTVTRPSSLEEAVHLSLIVSKLSPIIGNLIEFKTIGMLNGMRELTEHGRWIRQDPGFPDALFDGKIEPKPGFEIKAWFPLATEITARFKDSQARFEQDNIWVALPAWLPSEVICGKPTILDVCVFSGLSVAKARDDHYHKPPYYLVLEPEDTGDRTRNLQQTNTAGYVWQDSGKRLEEAQKIVESWGTGSLYSCHPDYQKLLRELTSQYKYRLDTNFAKMDRIMHPTVEAFKERVLASQFQGRTVGAWSKILGSESESAVRKPLAQLLGFGGGK